MSSTKCLIWRDSISKKLNDIEGKGQYQVEISHRLAALENLDADVDINRI
jgi:hypothetical protein